jgi:hypothetical protein
MKRNFQPCAAIGIFCCKVAWFSLLVLVGSSVATSLLRADQIEMNNGDHYVGRVLSLTTNTVVLQSEVLGTVTLAREKVAAIAFGAKPSNASTNFSGLASAGTKPRAAAVATTAPPDISAGLRQLRNDTNAIKQVESEYLADASPEAKAKFNEMLNGLSTGRLTVNDIRSEAKSAADKLRNAKRELGDEAGDALDGYLAILDNFLKESAPVAGAGAKSTGPAPKSKPANPESD